MRKIFIVLMLLLSPGLAHAGLDTLTVKEKESKLINKNYFQQLEDPERKMDAATVIAAGVFKECRTRLPRFKLSSSVLWLKLILKNQTSQPFIPISIKASIIDRFDLYYLSGTNKLIHLPAQQTQSGNNMLPKVTAINCSLLPGSTRVIYLRIQSNAQEVIPIEFHSANTFWQSYNSKNIAFGVFLGIIFIMGFYNLLLYFVVKDTSYLYYVCYITFLGISQSLSRGYTYNITNQLLLNNYYVPLSRMIFWLSIIFFVNEFLQLKNLNPKAHRYYHWLWLIFILPVVFLLLHRFGLAYALISFSATVTSIVLLCIGTILYIKGYKPAKFFMFGWLLFLVSIIATVARNRGMLPYNDFTTNMLLYGSAFELVLFSIALADKINFYRDQNNQSQLLALKVARENERLTTEQNIELETKVLGRTKELIESNKNLTALIQNLRAAQAQLVETEKMASLGQLTAGIAHEINNPINFVRSNIKPLKLDFKDIFSLLDQYASAESDPEVAEKLQDTIQFKQKIDLDFTRKEITDLLNGIEEGASRTAEIVQSLRAFSRTDEVELKHADINRSILDTLVLLRSTIPYYIEITPVLDKLQPLNCYPGKVNQVLMNLVQNSIQAIKEKRIHSRESILIKTRDYPENITIEITDTGTGMTEETKQKIFDPFFTTKEVGEGTGLGLSIVFGIIEKHHGAIEVNSLPGKGTTFLIMLPKTLA